MLYPNLVFLPESSGFERKPMKTFFILTYLIAFTSTFAHADSQKISKDDVLKAQKQWAEGIVEIGKVYADKGDYKSRATKHIKDLYAYDQGTVMFKPTLASEDQFRETFDEALSYFVKGKIEEDGGFAIKPWAKVRFGEQKIITDSNSAVAMGNYFFTPVGSDKETKVEYTFGYVKDKNGKLRINVHHSSLPYSK